MLKSPKATTPSQRNYIKFCQEKLSKFSLLKSKLKGFKKLSGRNNLGKITSAAKGGGHKQRYRKIEFFRKDISTGIVISQEYAPNRNCNIMAIFDFITKNYFYIIAPKYLKIGDIVKSGKIAESRIGHTLPVSRLPAGSLLHCISVKSFEKSQISRSAGTFSLLIEKTIRQGRIQVSSGEQRFLSGKCLATIGVVSNDLFFLTTRGKAGRSRWLNDRPKVRGVAKNSTDHPHGGGEGKTSKKRNALTPWGKPVKKGSTSRSKNKLVIR